MNSRLLNYVSSLQTDIGIDGTTDTINFKIWKMITLHVMVILATMSFFMVSIVNRDDFNAFVAPAPYIAATSVVMCGVYVTFHHRRTVSQLLHTLDTNLYNYPDEDSIQIDYEWYLQDDNINIFVHYLFYWQIFIFIMGTSATFVELLYYRSIRTFIYPTWTPWKMDNVKVQICTYLFEITQTFCGLYFNQMLITFPLVIIVQLVKQYQRLEVAIRSLEARTLWILTEQKLDEKEFDRVMHENIVHCIRHHQRIHKSYHLFKIWFEAFFSLELAICLAAFAFALYVTMNTTDLPQLWNFFNVLLFMWSGFLIRCSVSEIFVNLNDRLTSTIFWKIDWLRMNRTNKRLLLMYHQKISSRFPGLYGLSVFEANRTTLTKIIRNTYSILNVLKFSRN